MGDGAVNEAVILIHGYAHARQGLALGMLVDGLVHETQAWRVESAGATETPAGRASRLRVSRHDGAPLKEVDLFEVYWGDLRPRLSDQSPRRKAIEGLGLIVYWLSPTFVAAFRRSLFMTFSMLAATMALLVWYGVVALVGIGLLAATVRGIDHEWAHAFAARADALFVALGKHPVASLLALLATLAPVAWLVDFLQFARCSGTRSSDASTTRTSSGSTSSPRSTGWRAPRPGRGSTSPGTSSGT